MVRPGWLDEIAPKVLRWLRVSAVVVVLISSCDRDPVWADPPPATASYYTVASCKREGTSGIWTASGERFDENALTAAMWDVPFGTLVKVTNLYNSKSVIVKINDRGPSRKLVKQGRIIDLSKGAFLKLSALRTGIIAVKVEILK
jgi:rare lipoprotein A